MKKQQSTHLVVALELDKVQPRRLELLILHISSSGFVEGGIGRAVCTSTIYMSIAQTSVVANVQAAAVTGDTDLAVVDHEGCAIARQQLAVLPLCHGAESRSWSKHGPTLELWIQYAFRQRSHCVLGYSYRREETLTYEVAEAAICADQVQARSARPSLHLHSWYIAIAVRAKAMMI